MNFEKLPDLFEEISSSTATCCTGTQCGSGYNNSGDRSSKVHGGTQAAERNQKNSGNC